jgi:phospholipid/cholesterol/gamma-HCH transport system substrate-binding protein
MARRNVAELVAGAVVLVVALGFLGYAVANTGHQVGGGYPLHARFDRIDGLSVGSDVRLAGVKVGSVEATNIDPKTFQAVVTFTVASDLKLPQDSSAQISSNGLLGGEFLAVVPGGDEATIPPGGTVTITQGAVGLEELLGKFIFNVGSLTDSVQKALHQGLPSQPAPDAPK